MKLFRGLLAALLMLAAAPAFASPLAYYNQPLDTPNSAANAVITSINAGISSAAPLVTASGTTTSTATGTRLQISVTGLTTAAAGTTSAAMTVTDTSVALASLILCSVNIYAGTGVPIPTNIIPAAGSFSFTITNVAGSGSLNATVPVSCMVFN
jgi:hypothetical protein